MYVLLNRRRWPSVDFDSKIYPNEMDDLKIKLGVLMITLNSPNTHIHSHFETACPNEAAPVKVASTTAAITSCILLAIKWSKVCLLMSIWFVTSLTNRHILLLGDGNGAANAHTMHSTFMQIVFLHRGYWQAKTL